jgi:glutamate-ammonia-ligase adenylyltransferase
LAAVSQAELRDIERELGAAGFADATGAALAEAPDPHGAALRAVELLRAALRTDGARLAAAWKREPAALLRILAGVCGVAPFLARRFAARPEWLLALLDEALAEPRTPESYAQRLDEALVRVAAGAEGDALRRFKYYELARIVVRDASEELVPEERVGETLAELSYLADALLARAFACAAARLAERLGPPRWRRPGGDFELRVAVLGLGKLGGEELNFSSDVDLVYVSESPEPGHGALGEGPSDSSPEEYAARLAGEFGRLVSEATAEGFLYRIDLNLRPEGAQGPLVIPSDALAAYYDGLAAMWEKAAFSKARPVAGDLDLGWRVVRRVHPMIYHSAMDFAGVDAIKEMKERVEGEHGGSGEEFNVKLGSGGIRDVEFIAQALQLLHGGRIPQVRGRSTQQALESLAQSGVLGEEEARSLLAAYRFLRRLENRLQMEAERQVHRLHAGGSVRERVARAVCSSGPDRPASFEQALDTQRRSVREFFERLFSEEGEDRVLSLFARGAPRLLHVPATRAMVEDLAGRFAREIDASADPELALNNLDRFIQGIGTRTFYYGLLLDRPELVPRLAALFGASKYLANVFASHPNLIEPVFSDPDVLLLSRAELERDLGEVRARLDGGADRDPVERALAALRLFHHRQLVNVGLLDLGGRIARGDAERSLSEIAQVCLTAALALAREQIGHARLATAPPPEGEFLVVGMGKLGSGELTYGSDLDVIFLYDVPMADDTARLEAQTYFVRLAQKLIWALDTRTVEGFCYAVDARLRPSGEQGPLVTSLEGFRQHHERSAMVWERQALLRARPVAGSASLGEDFDDLRREILGRPPPADLGAEIHRIRMRMETELAQERRGHRDLKVGRGGLVDVESVVQFLQLRHGRVFPQLFDPESIETQLACIEELELLSPEQVRSLREGWEFLQRLSSRLRIVQNRSISDLREDRADLDSVARALGYAPSRRSGDARRFLLEDYRRHTEAIRRVYLGVLGVG